MNQGDPNRRRTALRVLTVLLIGVTAGVIVGGAIRLLGPGSNEAQAAAPGPHAVLDPGVLPQGRVIADRGAGAISTAPALGTVHTDDGAAAAFTAYAEWLIGAPAAAADPQKAAQSVGGTVLNPVDARLVADMQRAPGDRFDATSGAYRILGHAGSQAAPSEVMVEVVAPLTLAGKTRWSTVGGVVTWTTTGWRLTSIRPTAVAQPAASHRTVGSFSAQERSRTLTGLGWQSFSSSQGR